MGESKRAMVRDDDDDDFEGEGRRRARQVSMHCMVKSGSLVDKDLVK